MMKTLCAASAVLSLGACAGLPGADPSRALPSQVLENLQHCKRTYQASVGGVGVPGGSLYIECPAQPYDAVAPAPEAAHPSAVGVRLTRASR